MSQQKLTVTGTGDSLFVSDMPKEYTDGPINTVADFIKQCDIRMTNLETNLTDFEYYGGAYSGGTWLNTRRVVLNDLLRYGFNYFGNANNHAFDYSFNGLLSTIDTLDAAKLAHSGTGRSLAEATKPAILEANGSKVAIFAVDASHELASKAGRATKKIPARPGVNYIGHSTSYKVTPEQLEQLKQISKATKINFERECSIATGYALPDPEGVFNFGGHIFTTDPNGPVTKCVAKDLKRITDAIKDARQTCDYAFLLIHCHDDDGINHANPPAYLTEFTHACIDAGVNAVFGGGCHCLRGIEMYNGAPIFYSLGDFIYQGLKVEHLPADFMEKYKVDIYASAEEALWVRSQGNKIGLHCSKKNFQTLLPKLEFENGKMTSFAVMPVYLTFDRKDDMNGMPVEATGAEADEIFELMNKLSAPFGVALKREGNLFKLA